jgi:formiminotetrahydrofolate cyclodeaminase
MSAKDFDYLNQSIKTYLLKLSQKTPFPGGGSVVALTGSLSSALINMVLNYTLGKEKYASYQDELINIKEENDKILEKFSQYIEEDSKLYFNIREHTKKNPPLANKYLIESVYLHFDICKEIIKIISFADKLISKGNRYLVSDAIIASKLAFTTFKIAKTSILVNIKCIDDINVFKKVLLDVEKLEEKIEDLYKKTTLLQDE